MSVDLLDLKHILQHTAPLWEELRGQQIFISGGTGFFGCWLLESFLYANETLQLDAQATVLTRNPAAFKVKAPHLAHHPALHVLEGDVGSFDFPQGQFRFVIHAATEASARLNQEQPLVMYHTILAGTQRMLEFARTHGTQKFLFTSSGAVYGKQPVEMTHIPETYTGAPDLTLPGSAYGEGKRAAEMLCCLYAHSFGLQVKIARCFAFVGPYLPLDAHFAIGNFIRDAMAGGPIRVNGDGTPHRSYLYAADLAIWLWTILFRGKSVYPYNVGSDQAISILNLAQLVKSVINPAVDIVLAKQPVPDAQPEFYVPDIQTARNELGLQAWIHYPDAISRFNSWILTNLPRTVEL